VLHEQGLRIRDPMEFFEEITRFKLLKGNLPTEPIYPAEVLDVLMAAYMAWLVANHPEKLSCVGDRSEGQIVLPATLLKSRY
jgi:hypothetical protein